MFFASNVTLTSGGITRWVNYFWLWWVSLGLTSFIILPGLISHSVAGDYRSEIHSEEGNESRLVYIRTNIKWTLLLGWKPQEVICSLLLHIGIAFLLIWNNSWISKILGYLHYYCYVINISNNYNYNFMNCQSPYYYNMNHICFLFILQIVHVENLVAMV